MEEKKAEVEEGEQKPEGEEIGEQGEEKEGEEDQELISREETKVTYVWLVFEVCWSDANKEKSNHSLFTTLICVITRKAYIFNILKNFLESFRQPNLHNDETASL